ncbi:MAG: hypothetical protein LAO03_13655 [Acidobacteriia bacterium]|nr:hypothetical protein [Terriglobia bacterium]
MAQQDKKKWRKSGNQGINERDLNQVMDILLTLDRTVLEFSMRIYNVSRRDRFIMREQNQRLHDAVRDYLPRLAVAARSPL